MMAIAFLGYIRSLKWFKYEKTTTKKIISFNNISPCSVAISYGTRAERGKGNRFYSSLNNYNKNNFNNDNINILSDHMHIDKSKYARFLFNITAPPNCIRW